MLHGRVFVISFCSGQDNDHVLALITVSSQIHTQLVKFTVIDIVHVEVCVHESVLDTLTIIS